MGKKKTERRVYTKELKLETVALAEKGEKPVSQIAKDLGIKARLLFLPPYSPDYNMIEKTWANMKRYLRCYLQYFQSVASAIYVFLIYQKIILCDYIYDYFCISEYKFYSL